MTDVIKVSHLYKDYVLPGGLTHPVLKDVSAAVTEGEFVSVMGPSGSGKSTFMNILGCLDQPTSGEYFLGGKDVSKLKKDELAEIRNKYLGFVFQGFNLLARRNIFDNVTMPMIYSNRSTKERKERAEQILKKVGLGDYLYRYPTQLSGGMQQRVAIARALVNDPMVIFADEPTGNLDTQTSEEIMNIFQQLNKDLKITIVMVTHEPDIASFSQRLIYIRDGVKERDFTIEEAKNNDLL
ncbi:MAG: ABC transporter ATP-binding protein [Rickettsiales bacterium]|jgi:putative ABC transport system ATP-binding protein|nr:ABC transporter ATP-binding protein [Rickettsiales bacterium]